MLSALLSGAGLGPSRDALRGDGGANGRDDDIGCFVLAIAADRLRPDFAAAARTMFGTLLECPATGADVQVRYPGWWEAERASRRRRDGVPLRPELHRQLLELRDAEPVTGRCGA